MNHGRVRPLRPGRRGLGRGLALGVAALTGLSFIAITAPPSSAAVLMDETFRNKVVNQLNVWKAPSTAGLHQPCLTAATENVAGSVPACKAVLSGATPPDADGNGAMQLSNNAVNEGGALLFDKPVQSKRGLHIEFDMFQYNAKQYGTPKRGGDGISFFLIDGNQPDVKPGNNGGALSYAGLKGGLVGIGFDEYGNFSNPNCKPSVPNFCGAGGPGVRPNAVVIRGAESTSYAYFQGVASPGSLAVDAAKTRDSAKRRVYMDLSVRNFLNVGIDYNDGNGIKMIFENVDLDNIPGQPPLPTSIKLGWGASTGSATAMHEIQGLKVSDLEPNINIKVSGDATIKAGATGTATMVVSNDPTYGPTNGIVTASYKVPDGLTATAATGDGWDCKVDGQTVTCTRDGVFANGGALRPGASYPPVTMTLAANINASGTVTGTATVDVRNDQDPADNTATHQINIEAAPGPDLSVTQTGDTQIPAGGTGKVQLAVNNAPGAGSTRDTVTTTFTAPPGLEITGAAGEGWQCTVEGQNVTCTRPGTGDDALAGGAGYPPIEIGLKAPADSPGGDLPTQAKVTTTADANPANDSTSGTINVKPAPGPDLSVTQTGDTEVPAGGTGEVQLTVSNAPGAGPTKDTVTTTFTAEPGVEITGASGDGWDCKVEGQTVTCTRPGTGDDALPGGDSYPPVKIGLKAPIDATGGPVGTTGSVKTPGDSDPGNDTTTGTVTVKPAPGPDLSIEQSGPTQLDAGDTGEVQLTVSNAPTAGPTRDTITTTFTAEPGLQVTGASGDGWDCKVEGQTVTCARPGSGENALKGGDTLPPVKVGLKAPDDSEGGAVAIEASVATPLDTNLDNNKVTGSITVDEMQTPSVGELDVTITSNPNPYKGGEPFTYTVTATNTGDVDVTGAKITADFPNSWEQVGWTCTASGGATCPAASGTGDINTTADLPAGGKLTYTVTCQMPTGVTDTFEAAATVSADGTSCPSDAPCTAKDVSGPAAQRLATSMSWWILG